MYHTYLFPSSSYLKVAEIECTMHTIEHEQVTAHQHTNTYAHTQNTHFQNANWVKDEARN